MPIAGGMFHVKPPIVAVFLSCVEHQEIRDSLFHVEHPIRRTGTIVLDRFHVKRDTDATTAPSDFARPYREVSGLMTRPLSSLG